MEHRGKLCWREARKLDCGVALALLFIGLLVDLFNVLHDNECIMTARLMWFAGGIEWMIWTFLGCWWLLCEQSTTPRDRR